MTLLRNAQFEELSAQDLLLTYALNNDYLLTLPIYVDWKKAAQSNAIIFRSHFFPLACCLIHIYILYILYKELSLSVRITPDIPYFSPLTGVDTRLRGRKASCWLRNLITCNQNSCRMSFSASPNPWKSQGNGLMRSVNLSVLTCLVFMIFNVLWPLTYYYILITCHTTRINSLVALILLYTHWAVRDGSSAEVTFVSDYRYMLTL